MRYLKQSTSVDLPIGPFLDETDGKTAETALTLTQPDIRLKKNGAAWAQKAAAQTLSHEENGYYEVTLDATDTDTLGHLRLAVHESGALPVFEDFLVVPANVYDSLVGGSDFLQVGLREIESTVTTPAGAVPGLGLVATGTLSGTHSTTTADLGANAPAYDISGCTLLIAGRPPRVVDSYNTSTGVATFSPAMASAPVDALAWALLGSAPASTSSLPGVDVVNWKGATAPAMTGDAYARLGAPAGASISADLATIDTVVDRIEVDTQDLQARTPAALVGGRMDASVGAMAANVMTAAAAASDLTTELQAGLALSTQVDALEAAVIAIEADTQDIQSRLPAALSGGRIDATVGAMQANVVTAAAIAADAVTELQAGLSTLNAAGVRTAVGLASANLDTQLGAIDDYIDTEVASLVTNVSTLLTNVSTILAAVDTEVAAIKAKTDNLPAAPAATSDIPTAVQVADALLGRNIAGGSNGGRTVTSALRRLRNRVAIAAGTLTVYQEDDTTSDHTAAVTTAAGNPISAIDPD